LSLHDALPIFFQHGAFLGGKALHGLDEVRDQVGAALVNVLDLRPLLVDVLLGPHERVVDADGPDHDPEDDEADDGQRDDEPSPHAIRIIRNDAVHFAPCPSPSPDIACERGTPRPSPRTRFTTTRSPAATASGAASCPASSSTR